MGYDREGHGEGNELKGKLYTFSLDCMGVIYKNKQTQLATEVLVMSSGNSGILYKPLYFYCVKYPYLILTIAYVLAGANMDDQTRIFFK